MENLLLLYFLGVLFSFGISNGYVNGTYPASHRTTFLITIFFSLASWFGAGIVWLMNLFERGDKLFYFKVHFPKK